MLIKLAWRNLWRNKLRTSIMVGAMVFGLVGVMLMIGFMNGAINSMVQNAIAYQTSHLQLHHAEYIKDPDLQWIIPADIIIAQQLDDNRNIEAWSGRFVVNGMVASARSSRGVRINGVDRSAEAAVVPIESAITQGQWLGQDGRHPVVLSERLAQRLRLRLGSKVVLTFSDVDGAVSGAAFRVVGLFETPSSAFDDSQIYVRHHELTALAGKHGWHEMAIILARPDSVTEVIRQLDQAMLALPVKVRGWREIQPVLAAILEQMSVSVGVMIGIFVVAMGFGIINIMLMAVFERTREFGVLMAIGMQKQRLFVLIMLETLMLSLVGVLSGLSITYLLMEYLSKHGYSLEAMADGLGNMGVNTIIFPYVNNSDYGMVIGAVVVAAFCAALYPARHILKQHPVDAMAEKH
ncbi:ABC transporter permease [Thaumasiovibrio sp. DFM-14]|uniref:ABC transporter permease n=1 Tax=Thaumasiovibrio sp. DFM-14 TaxID=3384792 RepID=UPI0039A109F8